MLKLGKHTALLLSLLILGKASGHYNLGEPTLLGIAIAAAFLHLGGRALRQCAAIGSLVGGNPVGILFELFLCYLFFYPPLSRVYYFAPVPWHVYLFAFHGTLLLLVFEEAKKYYRRRGYPLNFLG